MNKSSKHPYNGMTPTSRKPLITALEPRILLDGAALATTLEMTTDLNHQQTTTTDATKDTVAKTMPDAPAPTQVKAVDPLLNNGRKEVVFIDTNVADYQSLIKGVGAGVEIELIDGSKDGLAQLTSWAQSNQNYDAIYLLSHGSSGQISLGTVSIDNTNINDYADSLTTIGQSLTTDGDLLVYGCDVAKSDSGKLLINSLAQLTQADVAASTNITGNAALGGDWSLEYTQGKIDFGVLPDSALETYDYTLGTSIDLSGKDGWTAIMYGVGKDPQGDSQAGAADTDIIGDATHGSLYTAYSDGGTPNDTSDDYLYFRMRIDNPTNPTTFNGVAIVGLDANGDGRVDLFISVDARNNTQAVRLLDPGTGLNNSPNTTSTSALPTGWLANNGIYDFTNSNFSVVAVSATTDPNWNGNADLGNAGGYDAFISWRVPLADLTTVLAKASPTDRYGNYGPRGSTGISGFSQDTTVSYVSFTQTQPGPINGDLNGVGKSYDKNATFAQLGAFTAPMTASDPVSASDFVRINSPISSDGLINATEDNSVAISGTASANQWVMLTVKDSTHTDTVWVQAGSTGTWSLATHDLSGFDEGTLTFDAKLVDANNSSAAIANASSDSVTATHDTLAPAIEITPLATVGKPTINGLSDLLAGSNIIVTIDPNGDGNLADKIMYTALVGTNGSWSVNTAVATPTNGSLPVSGLTAYAKITAEGTDTAGNTGTATAIDKPTVNSLTTQSVTPTISGTWGGTNGGTDTLSVTVNGVTYMPTISGNTWTVALNNNSLAAGHTYDVVASVTRSSVSITDATVGELTIVSGPVVDITGSATASTSSSKPTLGGTSTPGAVITLQIDLDNSNSTTNDRVTYSAVADGNGIWSINTATATPISGTLPASGLSGTVGLLATVTDSSNHTATDTQALTITVPSISIASVTGALPVTSGTSNDGILNGTEDNASVIYINATNIATNQTIAVTVSDGVHSNVTGVASYDAVSGKWKTTLDLSSLNDGTNALNILASFNSGQTTASTQVSHDSEAYASVTSAETSNTTPTLNGTVDATSSSLVIKVDRYTKQGNSILFNNTTYYSVSGGTIGSYSTVSGISLTGNSWSLSVAQSGGTFNNTGEYLLATVIGTDAAGNTVNATGQVTKIPSSSTANTISINTIAGDNIINESEDNSVSISGSTTVSGGYILVTLTDGTNSISQQVQASGTSWSLNNQNLDNWKDGPVQVEAKLLSGSNSTTVVASALATPTHVNSITAAPTIAISNPIGDGNLSANEDSSVTVSGTTTNAVGSTVTVTINGTAIGTATVSSNGTWSTTFDSGHSNALSSLADGTLNVSASVTANSATATDSTTVLHDRTPPAITITPLLTTGKPTIQGTTDLTAGSIVTVTIDPDNNSNTSDTVTYQATVLTGGTWSVDLSSATPTTGSLSQTGLTAYAKITATGTDAAGNSSTTTALDKPVVNTNLTNSGTPTLTGTWTYISGDVLSVLVANSGNTVSHTYTAGDGHLVANSDNTWTLTIPAGNVLPADTYNVTATVSRNSTTASDTTSSELIVDTAAPSVGITHISNDSGTSSSDFVTNDNSLIFSGSAETNSNVLITLKDAANNTIFTTTVVAAGGVWSIDRNDQTNLPDGHYTLTATATDAAGNSATDTQNIVIDTKATIGITTNYSSATTTPIITGSSDLGANQNIDVTISGATYTVQTQSDGSWSIDLATANPSSGSLTPLTNGNPYTITASGSDLAGNTATANKAILIDTSAPSIAITAPLDWNGNNNDTLTISEDTNVVIKGTTAKGASTTELAGSTLAITITDGNMTISDTATVLSDGSWQLAPLNLRSMASGNITVNATYIDNSGVAYTDIATILHDKTASVSIDSLSRDTGIQGDFVTADNTLVFSGSATPNSTVTLNLTGPSHAFSNVTVTANSNGVWSYDYQSSTLTDGNYILSASVIGSTVTQNISIDTAIPTGVVTVNSLTTNDRSPTITGTAVVNSGESLSVTVNGVTYSTDGSDLSYNSSSHTWSLTIPNDETHELSPAVNGGFDGVYSVTATIRDIAGNVLNDSSTRELLIDTTPPVAPTPSLTTDSGSSNTDKLTNVGTLSLTGVESGAVVEYSTNGTDWTSSFTAAEGSNTVYVRQTDSAGNVSAPSAAFTFVQDTTAPTVTIQNAPATHTGEPFTITLKFNENVTGFTIGDLSVSGADLSDFTALNGNTYTVTVTPYVLDTITLDVPASVAQDGAGNNNTAATQINIDYSSIDDIAPTISLTSNVASLHAGQTALVTFTLSEAATDFDVSDIVVNGGTLSNFSGSGTSYTATFTPTAASTTDGTISVASSRFTDAAGNANTNSNQLSLSIDTAIPVAPTLALTTDSGSSNSDNLTNVGTLSLTGVESGAVVEYSTNGTDWTGSFTAAEGSNTVYVRQTDSAGNVSAPSAAFTFVRDTVVPTIALTSNVASLHAGQTATVTFTLSEAASDFDINDIVVSGGTLSNFSGSGTSYTATFTPTAASTTDGAISVASSRFTDAAGNANTNSNQLSLSIDTAIPVAPTLALTTDSGSSNTDNLTNVGTLSLTGVESGAVVEYSTNGTDWTSSFTAAEGSNTVYVRQTDSAGNVSAPSAAFTFVRDTVVPTIALTSNVASLHAGQTATVTFTLSEAASDFDINDIVVSGGTLSNFSGSGTSYTATFTPTAASTTDGTISVASSRFTDAAGNANTNSNQLSLSIDTAIPVAPTLALTTDSGSSNTDNLTNVGTLSLTGVESGAVVEYSTNGTDWTSSFTAAEGSNTVYVRQTDSAGNVSAPSAAFTFVRDTTNPNNATGVLSVAERSANGTVVGIVTATDNIGPVTYSLSDNAGGRFTIDSNTGAVTVTNGSLLDDEINSSHNITVRITDAAGNQTNTVMSVAVTAVNRAPIAINDTATAREAGGTNNTTLGLNPSGNVLANDLDPDSGDSNHVSVVSFSGNNGVVGQAIDGNYGSLTLLSNGNYSYVVNNALPAVQALRSNSDVLTETFTYTVQDAGGLTSTATLTITINGANDAPVATNDNQDSSWNFGRDYYKDVSNLFTDVDGYGEKMVYSISGLPAGLTFDPASGIISGQPVNSGNFNITISAIDSSGSVASKSYALTIIAPAQTVIPTTMPAPAEIQPTPAVNTPAVVELIETTTSTLPTGVVNTQGHTETSGYLPSSNELPSPSNSTANVEATKDNPEINAPKKDQGSEIVSVNVNADGKVVISDIPQKSNDTAGLSIKNVELNNGDIQVYIIDAKPSKNYSATLSDGTTLPDWVSIDPTTGALSIKPPPGEKNLIIKIYATGQDGAIRILEVKLNVEDLTKQQHVAKIAPHAEFIPLEQQFSMETAMVDGYGERIASLLVV
nr:Ig-like domain-containing protein [uncultured Tolumonas sp.]